jgi:transcriptional regulator with XRE-family HTH domain
MAARKGRPRVGNDPFNAALGARVRERRVIEGLSQTLLAEALSLTFQQVQKYESGANRISVAMLVRMAPALNTTPAALLEGLTPKSTATRTRIAGEGKGGTDREALILVQRLRTVRSPQLRRALRGLIGAISFAERR